MFMAGIGTAGVISALFFRQINFGYILNVSDSIKGQLLLFPSYLGVFECGLLFWLFVLLRTMLHDSGDHQADIRKVAELAKLITPITTVNLCGWLLAPFIKLPLQVRCLVLFQVSSNLALLLIWAYLLITHTPQGPTPVPLRGDVKRKIIRTLIESVSNLQSSCFGSAYQKNKSCFDSVPLKKKSWFGSAEKGSVPVCKATGVAVHNIDGVGGKVDEAEGSGSGHGSGSSGSEENRGRYGGNDGRGGAGGGGDRGASGSGHGSGASGSGGGSEGGDRGRDGGGDRGASGSGHYSGASGNGGGSEGGDRGRDGGGADLELGGRGTNTEQAFKSSKITKMSLVLTAQAAGTLMGFHTTPTPSSSSKALLNVALMDQLVGYLCGVTSILLSSNELEDSKAANIFANIGFICTVLGFILMVAMFVSWYLVLIAVLLFGVVWLILFRNGLKTLATEVWNYLKNIYHRDAI